MHHETKSTEKHHSDIQKDFKPLVPSNLVGRISVVPQSLDNQWVPRKQLTRFIRDKINLIEGRNDFSVESRANYIRSLINNETVLVDRAFPLNNDTINRDFLEPGDSRKAFQALLADESIVPVLGTEQAPTDIPNGFTKNETAVQAWQETVSETKMACLRLTWNDDRIKQTVHQKIAQAFDSKFNTLFTAESLVPTMRLLGMKDSEESAFFARLSELRKLAINYTETNPGRTPQREFYYQNFVVADGTRPVIGQFDKGKEYAAEIKQLLDLAHASVRADAYGAYSISPPDSASRMALQETDAYQARVESWNVEQLLEISRLIRSSVFDAMQQNLVLPHLHQLTLPDIVKLRQTDEWFAYIDSLKGFVSPDRDIFASDFFDNPNHGAPQVLKHYRNLAKCLIPVISERRMVNLEKLPWIPWVEIVLEVAGATIMWSIDNSGESVQISVEDLSWLSDGTSKKAIIRYAIRNAISGYHDLETSIQLREGRLENARGQWQELVAKLKESKKQGIDVCIMDIDKTANDKTEHSSD
uniref:Uncharacterized protein n=1 Tax=Candidatus Kentrum sp. TC TaxID=2126339 RepID=A0A450ZD22_9GAMM|nr:MAG: hypothetical protein BECKTC1821D_GA0114238_11372 [Candidatus Kentron sp. TC]